MIQAEPRDARLGPSDTRTCSFAERTNGGELPKGRRVFAVDSSELVDTWMFSSVKGIFHPIN